MDADREVSEQIRAIERLLPELVAAGSAAAVTPETPDGLA
jgi:hypothetical protein